MGNDPIHHEERGRGVSEDIALIVRLVEYRGDHSAEAQHVIRVPLTCTVVELLEIGKKFNGFDCIEVRAEAKP